MIIKNTPYSSKSPSDSRRTPDSCLAIGTNRRPPPARLVFLNDALGHRAHLPPSAHTTFVTAGAVICSFLPRPLEQDADALKVPFFHRNTDYDEFIFYHDGDFFSRDNIKAGMATLHPRGIHHGPHPKALANQGKKSFTDESAVMLDGLNPIDVLPAGESVEWKEYWMSWMEQK